MTKVIQDKLNDGNLDRNQNTNNCLYSLLDLGNKPDMKSNFCNNKDELCLINDSSIFGEISNVMTCNSGDKFDDKMSSYVPLTPKSRIGLSGNSTSENDKDLLSAHITKEAQWGRAICAVFQLAESLDIKYPDGPGISPAQQAYEVLYKLTANLKDNWVKLINKEAYLVPYSLMNSFTLTFHGEERVFIVQTKEDIILKKQEKTVIMISTIPWK